jgi:anaerobic selenocysteine-containing dehydrogenase
MNETDRRFADVVLPGTTRLEELGFTGHATVASLRAAGGFLPLKVPHVA